MIARVFRRFFWVYPLWIALCAVLFVSFRGANDPSRRGDRLLNTDAGVRAVAILRQRDRLRFRDYEPVHVAWAGRGEGGDADRWIVLCDHAQHSGLTDALVVEVDGKDGHLLAIRRDHVHLAERVESLCENLEPARVNPVIVGDKNHGRHD